MYVNNNNNFIFYTTNKIIMNLKFFGRKYYFIYIPEGRPLALYISSLYNVNNFSTIIIIIDSIIIVIMYEYITEYVH